jgi:MFS family permease
VDRPVRRPALSIYRGAGLDPTVKALGATSFFQDVASEMVYPLLPAFLASLGGGPLVLGAMESVAEGVLAILKGLAGRWSDRAGKRKPFISAGYGLSALIRPGMAVASTALQVVVLRAVDRVAKGLRTAPRDALISEVTPAADRGYAFSFHRGLDHLGAAVGPLLAAAVLWFAPDGVRWVFGLATIPALVGWMVVQFAARESGTAIAARAAVPSAREFPRALRLPLAAMTLFALGNASDAFLLLRASQIGLSAIGLTFLWSGFHVCKWLASAPAGRIADRIGSRPLILTGWLLYAGVYAGFARAGSAAAVLALFAVYAVYYGITEGAERKLIVELAGGALGAGSSLGAFHAATGVGTFLASLLFGFLWQKISPAAAFLTGAALALAAAVALVSIRRSPNSSRPRPAP